MGRFNLFLAFEFIPVVETTVLRSQVGKAVRAVRHCH
jgi:hypothetical protein